jgi:hypothetical protein
LNWLLASHQRGDPHVQAFWEDMQKWRGTVLLDTVLQVAEFC